MIEPLIWEIVLMNATLAFLLGLRIISFWLQWMISEEASKAQSLTSVTEGDLGGSRFRDVPPGFQVRAGT